MGFETKDHIADQERIGKLWAEDFKARIIKTPMYWPFDYVAERGGKLYAIECRQRYNAHNLYPTLNLSAKKWESLQFAKSLVSGVFFIVGWSDGWGWVEVKDQSYRISFGGRSLEYIRVTGDREWMVEIPIKDFVFWPYEPRRVVSAVGTACKSTANKWTSEPTARVVFGD